MHIVNVPSRKERRMSRRWVWSLNFLHLGSWTPKCSKQSKHKNHPASMKKYPRYWISRKVGSLNTAYADYQDDDIDEDQQWLSVEVNGKGIVELTEPQSAKQIQCRKWWWKTWPSLTWMRETWCCYSSLLNVSEKGKKLMTYGWWLT